MLFHDGGNPDVCTPVQFSYFHLIQYSTAPRVSSSVLHQSQFYEHRMLQLLHGLVIMFLQAMNTGINNTCFNTHVVFPWIVNRSPNPDQWMSDLNVVMGIGC